MRLGIGTAVLLLATNGCMHSPAGGDARQLVGLEEANRREVAAFLATDAVTLERLWRDDFIVTNPLNQVATKAQVLQMVRDGFLTFRSYERRMEYTRRYGDVAVVVGSELVEWSGRMPLAGKPVTLRFTAMWRNQNGEWREVVRHANVVPPGRPASQ